MTTFTVLRISPRKIMSLTVNGVSSEYTNIEISLARVEVDPCTLNEWVYTMNSLLKATHCSSLRGRKQGKNLERQIMLAKT